MKNNRVLVYGAYGHTGRFVIAQLLRQGLTPVLAGRSRAKLEALSGDCPDLDVRVAPVDDPSALNAAMRGIGAVINTAGPFLDTAGPVAEAAVRAGAHYVDVSAEQGAVRDLYETFGNTDRETTTAVVAAMSFYGGLADLLVSAAAAEWDDIDRVEIGIGLNRWWPTTGTLVTGERNTATRLVIDGARLVPASAEPVTRSWDFAHPIGEQTVVGMPFSEMVTMNRHLSIGHAENYLSAVALADIRETSPQAPRAIDELGRSAQRFIVDVSVERQGQVRAISAAGQDIYQVTAPLAVEAVTRLLDGRFSGTGALAPGEAFAAADFLTSLDGNWLSLDVPQVSSLRRTISAIHSGAKGEVQPGGVG